MEILNLILIIYLLMQVSSIKKKLNLDEVSETELSNTPKLTSEKREVAILTQPNAINNPPETNDVLSRGITWLQEDWMLKLGGLFILLASGWFITYAFMNNWIGEIGRIVFGIFCGCIFMIWGSLRMRKVLREGEILLIIGAIILVTSIFAGQHLYHLYSDFVSLPAMTFVALVIASIAYINRREVLAICGVLMIGISPILAGFNSVSPNIPGILTYLFCMSLGVLWLSKVTGWRSITFLTVLVVFAYIYPHFMQYYEYNQLRITGTFSYKYNMNLQKLLVDTDILRFFAIVFSIIFNMSSFITLLFDKKASRDDFKLVAISAGFAAFSLYTLGTPSLLALELVIMAMLFMILAVVLARITKYSYYVELYSTVSILFLISSTLKTARIDFLPTALSAEAILLTIFYRSIFGTPYPFISVFLYGGSFLISFSELSNVGRTWQQTVGFISTLLSTYFPYYLSLKDKGKEGENSSSLIPKVSLTAGNFLASFGFYTFIENVGTHLLLTQSLIKGIRYAVYAIVGSFLYFTSRSSGHKIKYFFGIGFILYVVVALLLYEVWMMEITARIVIFFLIGLLFISSIYFLKLYENKKS